MKHIRHRALRGYYALSGVLSGGAFERVNEAVAVVVAAMLTLARSHTPLPSPTTLQIHDFLFPVKSLWGPL